MTKAWLGLVLLCVACPGGLGGATKADAKADAKADVNNAKTDGKTDAKGDGEAIATPPVAAGDDWLVWWFKDDRWSTRWLRVEGEAATVVGEKKALVIGDGPKLWQVERADKRVKVMGCECDPDPKSEHCVDGGYMPSLGLRARPLGGIEAVAIKEASTETEYGDEIDYGLSITGGVQGRLHVMSSVNGYLCGAHGLSEASTSVFDVALGRAVEAPFDGDWWKSLPEPLRKQAAEAIKEPLNGCDVNDEPPATVDEIMKKIMTLDSATLALVGGVPTISWSFMADLPYVCSPDYGAHGGATSGLIPEAAALGLAGPLPAAVLKDIQPIGDAKAFGFSHLALGDREAAIAAFAAVTEVPWPKEDVSDRDDAPAPGLAKLNEGRKLSRAGDLQKAIAAFDEAIKLEPELAAAWSERGYARLRAADYVGAKKDSEKALGLEAKPSFQAAVWFNLGQIAEALARPDEAKAAYLKSQGLRETKQVKAALDALAAGKK